MVESIGLYGGEYWAIWWGGIGYMVKIVVLHGGECWVIWCGVLCYMGDVGLQGREYWVHGDSLVHVREWRLRSSIRVMSGHVMPSGHVGRGGGDFSHTNKFALIYIKKKNWDQV